MTDTLFDGKVTTPELLENLTVINWEAAPTVLHLAGFQDTLKTYSWNSVVATDQRIRITPNQLAIGHFVLASRHPLSGPGASAISLVLGPHGTPIVGYTDASLASRAIIKKWDAASQEWRSLGGGPITVGAASVLQLSYDTKFDMLYAAVNDEFDSNRVTVYQWQSSSSEWTPAGERSLTPPNTAQMGFAITNSGQPYLAFKDDSREIKASVVRYDRDRNQWEMVGEPGFTEGEVNFLSLAVDSEGHPYIGYYDELRNGRATVMRFNPVTKAWEGVGEPGFTPGRAVQTQIRLDGNNTPYLLFIDGNTFPNVLSAMRFQEGRGWSLWPETPWPENDPISYSSHFTAQNHLHFAYSDAKAGAKATLLQWEPTQRNWQNLGPTAFSPAIAWDLSLALSDGGKPWLAFSAGMEHRLFVMEWVIGP